MTTLKKFKLVGTFMIVGSPFVFAAIAQISRPLHDAVIPLAVYTVIAGLIVFMIGRFGD